MISAKYIVTKPGTHAQCALEICPALGASLACIPDENTNRILSRKLLGWNQNAYRFDMKVWIGLYKDPAVLDAKDGWDSWASGCDVSFRRWWMGQPKAWTGGRCRGERPLAAERSC